MPATATYPRDGASINNFNYVFAMKTERELRLEEERAAQPKYNVGLRVWYYANAQRHEGEIAEIRQRYVNFFYRIGTDWVPQEQLVPVEA